MKNFYPIIKEHIDYVLAMRRVFQKILERLLPGRKSKSDFFGGEEQFKVMLDDAFARIDSLKATVQNYRLALEAVCCNDVEEAIDCLISICRDVGFEKYAYRYLNKKRFVAMMCDCDKEKLAKLEEIVNSGDKDLGRVLMRVSGVLDGRQDAYESLDEAAKEKANEDAQNLVKRVCVIDFLNLRKTQGAIEHKPEEVQNAAAEAVTQCIGSVKNTVETIEKKVDNLTQTVERQKERSGSKKSTKRECAAVVRNFCSHSWKRACENVELRNSLNTRMTYQAAFTYYQRELADYGVKDKDEFKRLIHSDQSLKHQRRKAALEAKMMVK